MRGIAAHMLAFDKAIANRVPVGRTGDTDAPTHPTSRSDGTDSALPVDRRRALRIASTRASKSLTENRWTHGTCQERAALKRDRTLPRYLGPTESELHLSVANLDRKSVV